VGRVPSSRITSLTFSPSGQAYSRTCNTALHETFGVDYVAYCREVPQGIPRLTPAIPDAPPDVTDSAQFSWRAHCVARANERGTGGGESAAGCWSAPGASESPSAGRRRQAALAAHRVAGQVAGARTATTSGFGGTAASAFASDREFTQSRRTLRQGARPWRRRRRT
jgi:hypothetical protein